MVDRNKNEEGAWMPVMEQFKAAGVTPGIALRLLHIYQAVQKVGSRTVEEVAKRIPEDRLTLEERLKRRQLAVDLFSQKRPYQEIANACNVSITTVSRWNTIFKKGGEEALVKAERPGPKP